MSFDDNQYISNLIEINKNLRDQIEVLHKLLKMKLKMECNTRLESYIDEMEILKTSLSFSLQKQSNVFSKIDLKGNAQLQSRIKEIEHINDNISKDNMLMKEHLELLERNNHNLRIELNDIKDDMESIEKERNELIKQVEDEKNKNRNLLNLIKEFEKRKGSDSESKRLREQIEILTNKLNDIEAATKKKLDQKDMLIKKLDSKLLEYENLYN
jgi:hypothetical protein